VRALSEMVLSGVIEFLPVAAKVSRIKKRGNP
jgi:hypothetical protein